MFEEFLDQCNSEDHKLFEGFATTNFESIQEQLLNAKKVNELLGLPTELIDPAVEKLRRGLITSVESNHPRAGDIDVRELQKASEALDPFKDVYTFNYDLLLYRMIMFSKDRSKTLGVRRHNDYFWSEYNNEFLEFKDFDHYGNKHVYFLHGALFLFPGGRFDYYNDLKLRRGNESFDELIEVVSREIEQGILPLFVSEGTPQEKMRVISGSPYLSFAYRSLEESERRLVIYGWSMSSQDVHMLSALSPHRRNRPKRTLAVSIYVGNKSKTELQDEVSAVKARLSHHKVTLFDSSTLFAT